MAGWRGAEDSNDRSAVDRGGRQLRQRPAELELADQPRTRDAGGRLLVTRLAPALISSASARAPLLRVITWRPDCASESP
jgi:hypothetical protein